MLVAYLFLITLCIIWVIPLIFSFATSFRSQTEIVSTGFRLLPVNWILDNYVAILANTSTAPIMQWLWNSLFYCRYSYYLSGNCCFCNSLWLWQNAFQIPRPYLLYSNGDFYVPWSS